MTFFDLSGISKYRQELMGFSAILILACHAVGNEVLMPSFVKTILNFGNIGVDMFLFLSGMGMYYSLKFDRGGVIRWYQRRYKRILIPYLTIAFPFYVFKVLVGDSSILDALCDISTISYWTHHRSAWFIALLLPLYAVTPLLSKIIDVFRNRWIPTILLSLTFIVSSVYLRDSGGVIANNVGFAISRVPCFVVGYWLGRMIQDGYKLNFWVAFFAPVLLFVSLYLYPGNIYCFWILMFPLMQLLICFFDYKYKAVKWFDTVCLFMGTITLESYLTNGFSATIIRDINWMIDGVNFNYGNYVHYTCVLVFGLLWAIVAHRIANHILKGKHST